MNNNRNRLHPLSTPKSVTSTGRLMLQTTTLAPVTTVGSSSRETSAERGLVDQRHNRLFASRFGTSREQISKSKPLLTTEHQPKRINVTHNGSANRDGGGSQEISNRTHQLQLLQQARQRFRGSSAEANTRSPFVAVREPILTKHEPAPVVEVEPADDEEELVYEDYIDEQNNDETITTPKSNEENKPVILTSNFFLPGKPLPNLNNNNQDIENQQPNELSNDEQPNKQLMDLIENIDEETVPDIPESIESEKIEENNKEITSEKTENTTSKPSIVPPRASTEEYDEEYGEEIFEYDDEATTVLNNSTIGAKKPESVQNEAPKQSEKEIIETTMDEKGEENTTILPIKQSSEKPSDEANKSSSEQIETPKNAETVQTPSTTELKENAVDSTESYVVVASVQTSRSISGARFLTFASQVEQDEKKQALSDLEKDAKLAENYEDEPASSENDSSETDKVDDLLNFGNQTVVTSKSEETYSQETSDSSKKQQHKLSTISEKLAHLHELNESRLELTTKSVPVMIRKFMPRTTTASPRKQTTAAPKKVFLQADDELATLLPPGFKYRAQDSTKAIATTTESAQKMSSTTKKSSIFDKIKFQEISFESLLPKDYKPPAEITEVKNVETDPIATSTTTSTTTTKTMKAPKLANLLSKISFEDNIAAFLPKNYTPPTEEVSSTTKAPLQISTKTEDISKFLPPGYKLPKESPTTKRTVLKTTMDDVSKFLPPGYKVAKTTTTTEEPTSKQTESNSNETDKIKFNGDISRLLPPGFNLNNGSVERIQQSEPKSTTESSSNYKPVFPKKLGIGLAGNRPGIRMTTRKPLHNEGPPGLPAPTIRMGGPIR